MVFETLVVFETETLMVFETLVVLETLVVFEITTQTRNKHTVSSGQATSGGMLQLLKGVGVYYERPWLMAAAPTRA